MGWQHIILENVIRKTKKKAKKRKPDIFKYKDYRNFLNDLYVSTRANDGKTSYRELARHIGFASINHLHQIFNKNRTRLSVRAAYNLADYFKLTQRETLRLFYLIAQVPPKRPKKKK